MELKEFIKIAICDITDAISELQSELNNSLQRSVDTPCRTRVG